MCLLAVGLPISCTNASSDESGCTKDSDCKGTRICLDGECADSVASGGVVGTGTGGTPSGTGGSSGGMGPTGGTGGIAGTDSMGGTGGTTGGTSGSSGGTGGAGGSGGAGGAGGTGGTGGSGGAGGVGVQCNDAGTSCAGDPGSCCDGSLCFADPIASTTVCAAECFGNSGCASGCCVSAGSGSVCAPPANCPCNEFLGCVSNNPIQGNFPESPACTTADGKRLTAGACEAAVGCPPEGCASCLSGTAWCTGWAAVQNQCLNYLPGGGGLYVQMMDEFAKYCP